MLVSVIVTTKNEEKNIANCLESIKNQTYKDIEIIVVDNNSDDNTKKIAKKYTRKVYNKGPERSAQRNFGVSKAKGKWILYLDADMILSPKIVDECVHTVKRDKELVGLYIPERIVSRNVDDFSNPVSHYQDSYWIKVRDFERSFYDGTVIDCVRFVSKKVFERIKGFDESLTGPEDWDFDKRVRMNGKVQVIKSVMYHNEGKFNMKQYLRKKKYYSRTMDAYIQKWGKNDKDVRRQLGAWYRLVGVFLRGKILFRLLAHPVLCVLLFILKFKVGWSYLTR